jgi:hypothetical protein
MPIFEGSKVVRLLTLTVGSLLIGCGSKEGSGDSGNADAAADALKAEIDGYTGWQQRDPWVGEHASADGTHGATVQIWANDLTIATLDAAAGGDMPEGALIVKEGYTDSGDTRGIAVMKKESGAWIYAAFSADGNVQAYGDATESGCGGRHSSGQDSVRAWTW